MRKWWNGRMASLSMLEKDNDDDHDDDDEDKRAGLSCTNEVC